MTGTLRLNPPPANMPGAPSVFPYVPEPSPKPSPLLSMLRLPFRAVRLGVGNATSNGKSAEVWKRRLRVPRAADSVPVCSTMEGTALHAKQALCCPYSNATK
eukprot:1158208-Pelagomonas_calceolata.AAC.59